MKPKRPDTWARLPGYVLGVFDKSISYSLRDVGLFSKRIYIPRSQLEVIPREGDKDILVKEWLATKSGWRTIGVKVCGYNATEITGPESTPPAKDDLTS